MAPQEQLGIIMLKQEAVSINSTSFGIFANMPKKTKTVKCIFQKDI